MTDEFDPFDLEVEDRGEIANLEYAVGPSPWAVDNAAFDVEELDEMYLDADELRAVADHIDRVSGADSDDVDPADPAGGWEDDDIILTDRNKAIGLVRTDSLGKVMGGDAQSVMLSIDKLRDALDVAAGIQDGDAIWLSAQTDRPLVLTSRDADGSLSASVAPLASDDSDAPTEGL